MRVISEGEPRVDSLLPSLILCVKVTVLSDLRAGGWGGGRRLGFLVQSGSGSLRLSVCCVARSGRVFRLGGRA